MQQYFYTKERGGPVILWRGKGVFWSDMKWWGIKYKVKITNLGQFKGLAPQKSRSLASLVALVSVHNNVFDTDMTRVSSFFFNVYPPSMIRIMCFQAFAAPKSMNFFQELEVLSR